MGSLPPNGSRTAGSAEMVKNVIWALFGTRHLSLVNVRSKKGFQTIIFGNLND